MSFVEKHGTGIDLILAMFSVVAICMTLVGCAGWTWEDELAWQRGQNPDGSPIAWGSGIYTPRQGTEIAPLDQAGIAAQQQATEAARVRILMQAQQANADSDGDL